MLRLLQSVEDLEMLDTIQLVNKKFINNLEFNKYQYLSKTDKLSNAFFNLLLLINWINIYLLI